MPCQKPGSTLEVNMRKFKRLLFLCVFIAVLGVNILAQGSSTPDGRFSDLTVEISSTKQTFIPLEPIPIVFRLANNTNIPIRGHSSFRFSSNFVELFVRNHQGIVRKIEPLSLNRIFSVGKEVLFPSGATVQQSELLKLELNRHFPSTGNYTLQAVFRSRSGADTIKSNWLAISISELQGANLAAYEYLKQGTDISKGFNIPETVEQATFFESFVSSFPDTPYSSYIQVNLAGYYYWNGDFEKARSNLQKLKTLKNFVLASRVLELQREIEAKEKAQ